jgi:hypothetical protein
MATLVTIFSSDLGQTVLAFILVFTIIFAILQKSEILGKGKKQIDALVALAVGLLVVSVGFAMDIITRLMPFLGVSVVIILVFMILFGFFFKQGEFKFEKSVITAFGILAFVAVVIAVLHITDAWGAIVAFFTNSESLVTNGILIKHIAKKIF